jgi:hypothetical protein
MHAGSLEALRVTRPQAVDLELIKKRYTKPASVRFWLLAYSIDSLLLEEDPDIAESRRLLEDLRHLFDEVWFLYPFADRESGAIVHVWPTNRKPGRS